MKKSVVLPFCFHDILKKVKKGERCPAEGERINFLDILEMKQDKWFSLIDTLKKVNEGERSSFLDKMKGVRGGERFYFLDFLKKLKVEN